MSKKILIGLLTVGLILGLSGLAMAEENVGDVTQSGSGNEVSSNVQITEEMMKEATPADEGTILIEIAKEEEETRPWEKYFYFDVDQNLNEDSQSFWTRVGMRKGSFDFSIGWTQKFNAPETEPVDKGTISMSMSYWW